MSSSVRVLLVAENVSASFGGESFLPLHYFRVLRARGVDAHLVTHARVRAEVEALFPAERERLYFVPETTTQVALWFLGHRALAPLSDLAVDAAIGMLAQHDLASEARKLVRRLAIDVVHQPIPVSPRMPSFMHRLGAPVVMGPMNGGIEYPAAFREQQGHGRYYVNQGLRRGSEFLHQVIPGKREASVLLVANERTREALPQSVRQVPTLHLVENGVDLTRFALVEDEVLRRQAPLRMAFVGRLVDWKAVDLLLEAMAMLPRRDLMLDVYGDGPEREPLERLAQTLGLFERVHFHGFVPQEEVAVRLDQNAILVLPSLRECGGAVVLEAMAKGMPVVATDWGGPADYLDPDCGFLVAPDDRRTLIAGIRDAIARLESDPELRVRMGAAGRRKVEREFDWELKVDRILNIYRGAMAGSVALST